MLLLLLTSATGVIDAVSILALGRVFVANMTGNVVFLGIALAHAPGFSLTASVAALAGFLLGAFGGGVVLRHRDGHRGRLLRDMGAGELALVVAAFLLTAVASMTGVVVAVVAGLLAVAMGLQNTAARRLAVPDLTTTVLTMTLTGIAADSRGSGSATITRRILAMSTMFAGALVGALLVLRAPLAWALALAVLLIGVVVLVAFLRCRHPETWHTHGL
ncbi:MAG TPA: YoaK family protein [Pseudonocardia sp.]